MSGLRLFAGVALAALPGARLCYAAGDVALDDRVKALIWEMGVPNPTPVQSEQFYGKQARLFRELESLGEPAVPYIIRYMDDRRPLPYSYIALRNNFPNAFEGMRQYGPKQVVDGLAGVLNQLTSHAEGFIYNGGTDQDRDEEVAAWRRWCANKWPDLKAICDGSP